MRRAYARGTRAWGYDARTGERLLLRDMVKDGNTGLPVSRRSYEPKHPQETPVSVFDPQVLRRPAPDNDAPIYTVSWPTGDWTQLWTTYPPFTLGFVLGLIDYDEYFVVYVPGVYEPGVYDE
jgi:hypothetical protein